MKLLCFKTLWGYEGSLEEAVGQVREAGFEGIEGPVPRDEGRAREFFEELAVGGVGWICEISTCTEEGVFVPRAHEGAVEHLRDLEVELARCLEGGPRFVTVMGGSDAWGEGEAMRFYEGVLSLEERYGVGISMETHRGRYGGFPWRMWEVVKALPELKVTCDFSHWCVVAERMVLDEEPGILMGVARNAYHVHGRIGYAQGAQVPDPRAPEYAYAVEAHERWWDVLWDGMRERGFEEVTMTPEFGPDGYLQVEPFSGRPVADLWDLNRWMGARLVERFEKKFIK